MSAAERGDLEPSVPGDHEGGAGEPDPQGETMRGARVAGQRHGRW
jgi:hypothetical protein